MKLLLTSIATLLLACTQVMADGTKSKVPLADPYILLDGDTYYAYGTHDADGIEVWTSDDLYVWEKQGLALNKENTTEDRWFWAPEVYNKNGKYYMYYSANEHLYVATSDSPLGPFKQESTYQMDKLIGSEKCIDSHVFFDDDGKAYCFFVRFTDGNCIWMCELEDDYMTPKTGTLKKCFAVSLPWESVQARVCEAAQHGEEQQQVFPYLLRQPLRMPGLRGRMRHRQFAKRPAVAEIRGTGAAPHRRPRRDGTPHNIH